MGRKADRYLMLGIAHAAQIAHTHYEIGLLTREEYALVLDYLAELTRDGLKLSP